MTKLSREELKETLDYYYDKYNRSSFIASDPISIPHQFTQKEDIEIAGFLSATIAWGKREMIIKNSTQLMTLMDWHPFEFIMNHSKKELLSFKDFKHRTFNGTDAQYFIRALKHIYTNFGGLEEQLTKHVSVFDNITNFHHLFFSIPSAPDRTKKHVSNPSKGSSSKRINMMLRWFCRHDKKGVDFGIWKNGNIKPENLICPLDVHTGNIARKLGLLTRKQNDWKAAQELTDNLKKFDSKDPVKYDFALFGAGINKDID